MKITQEELDQLNKDIVEAQDKLGQISSAINRDRLIMEETTKTRDELLKEQESLISGIEWLKQKKNNLQLNIVKVDEENNQITSKFKDEKLEKQTIIKSLDETIEATQWKLVEIEAQREKKTENMETEYLSIQTKLEKQLGKQIEANEKAKKENDILTEKKGTLAIEMQQLAYSIDELKKILKSKETEYNGYDDKITQAKMDYIEKAKQSEDLVNSIQSLSLQEWELRTIIADLNGKKAELEVQIDQNNKVLAQYVQDKMQLLKDKETLKEKENYIREKFQQAGLIYS